MEIENDIYKLEGQIRFKIEKFSEFSQAPVGTERQSDLVFVRGLPWHILVINREYKRFRHLDYFLICTADNSDSGWSCAAKAKLKILARKEGKDRMRSIEHVYNAISNNWGIYGGLTFEYLMASENGFYDEQTDTIVLATEITAEAQQITERINFTNAKPDTNITVNNESVAVLKLSSTYFDRYFFDDRYARAENIELPPSTTVEHFKRMLATLPPEHRQLDDGCIEAVLILSDRFFMDNVTEICRKFLTKNSRKPKLFKFRMAQKYGWKEMEEILESMTLEDFNAENFVKNADEYAMLDESARAALITRHAKLVSGNSNPAKE